jgi:curved DNA-binding protein CbpA
MKTPYEILGVPRNASDEAIRMAFRRAAKAFHPDINAADPAAEQQLKQIIAAYEILKTPQQRAMYDQSLAALEQHGTSIFGYTVRDFASPAVVGLASGSVVALVVWLSFPLSNGTEFVAPLQPLPQSISNPYPTADRPNADRPNADRPKSDAVSAREKEQALASSDADAIREFAERIPDASESAIARSKLIALIDSAEDVFLLQALSMASNNEIAERAQQRLSHLRRLTGAKDDSRVGRAKRDESNAVRSDRHDFDQATTDHTKAHEPLVNGVSAAR